MAREALRRIDLQKVFEDIMHYERHECDHQESPVYFQPPDGKQLQYPCIIYELSGIDAEHGDNIPYAVFNRYQVTVIDSNPDSPIPQKIRVLQGTRFDRFFAADNLNHWVFELYYG